MGFHRFDSILTINKKYQATRIAMTQKKTRPKNCIGQSQLVGGCIENCLLNLGGVLWCEVWVLEHDSYKFTDCRLVGKDFACFFLQDEGIHLHFSLVLPELLTTLVKWHCHNLGSCIVCISTSSKHSLIRYIIHHFCMVVKSCQSQPTTTTVVKQPSTS
jgi:hypothetical protein